jgi:hypothetical protein
MCWIGGIRGGVERNHRPSTYLLEPSIYAFGWGLLFLRLWARVRCCRRTPPTLREVGIRALTSGGPEILLRRSSATERNTRGLVRTLFSQSLTELYSSRDDTEEPCGLR